MAITVQITPDGKATEMSSEEADEQKGNVSTTEPPFTPRSTGSTNNTG